MRDISKKLTVINTGKKESEAGAASQPSGVVYVGAGGGGGGGNLNDYLLKSIWNKVWEIRTDSQGTEYIFSKLPVVTQYGITMYSGDNVDIPTIAEGLPFDNRTIWFNPETNQIEVIGGTGGGEGVSNFWDLSGVPSWITNEKPKYRYSEIKGTPDLSNYVVKSYVDENFVTFTLDEVITGIKSFTNGLKIGESLIKQLQEDVVYIDANLVVRGGITMYYDDGEIDIPNIKDQIGPAGYNEKGLASFDQTYFTINNGHVSLIEGAVGLNEDELLNYLTSNQYAKKSDIPSLSGYATQSWVESKGFALNSDLITLSTKVNDFLEGSDTDNIINKWKELETFLSGLSQSDNLATILGNKAEKTDLAKYIPIAGATDITGEKNFIGGLKVNGSPIYYDTEKKYWKLEGDLIVTGGVTMYGNDSDFVASTIMDAISVDGTTISKEGGVLKVIGGTGGGISSVTSQMIVDALGYTPASATALSGYLPLSGGTLSNGTSNTPLTIKGIQDGSWISYTNQSNTHYGSIGFQSDNQPYAYHSSYGACKLWHSGNFTPSNYLPLSGGTISNSVAAQLKILNSIGADAYIEFGNTDAIYGHVGVLNFSDVGNAASVGYSERIIFPTSGGMYYRTSYNGTNYTIWHSGNDGSGSGLDADLLDGIESSKFYKEQGRFWSTYANSILGNGSFYTQGYSPVSGAYTYGSVLNFKVEDKITQFYITDGGQPKGTGGRMFFRDLWNASESITTRWIEVITSENIDSHNAGSATKLQTARTIWGQSFNGTGNVDGLLSISEGSNSNSRATINLVTINNNPCDLYLGANNLKKWSITSRHSSQNYAFGIYNATTGAYPLWIDSTTNYIGIGTISPFGNLHVVGSTVSTAGFYGGNAGETPANYWWGLYQWNGQIQMTRRSTANVYESSYFYIDIASKNIVFSAGVTMYSDIRKKTKLQDVELSLKQIANAPLIEHYYNSDDKKTTHVGSIAQYWAEMNDWFCKKDSEGFYTMEIQNAALASAISVARELVKFETETDRRIRLLEEENKRLKEEVEYLKLNVA